MSESYTPECIKLTETEVATLNKYPWCVRLFQSIDEKDWKGPTDKNGVQFEEKSVPYSPTKLIRLTLDINCELDKLKAFITDFSNFSKLDDLLLAVEPNASDVDEATFILRLSYKSPMPLVSKRDFCCMMTNLDFAESNTFCQVFESTESEKVPENKDFVRGKIIRYAWYVVVGL
eukprot:TRINITY_DN67060_c7_g4_i1.p1 TRINITY_DN67060_c7_g4~~TRINITY_DN67060_c7_g4_i1.p1  ORF type:complete len:175 (+),score=14.13 TRINITY_DN67060_c7_g4_i1:47-571(+)